MGYDIKIHSLPSLFAIQRAKCVGSLANENKIVRSSRYDVRWLALPDTTWKTLARSLARSLACDTIKNVYYCCSLIVIQHKNNIFVRHRSRCYIELASLSSHPHDVTAKHVDVIASRDMTKIYSRELWHKSQMVAEKRGHKPTTSRLVGISTLLFQGMIFE